MPNMTVRQLRDRLIVIKHFKLAFLDTKQFDNLDFIIGFLDTIIEAWDK